MTAHAKETEVQDVEFTEVEEKAAVKCAVSVGMSEAGDIFFNVEGSDQNLLLMEGLLKYAERHMERVWKERLGAPNEEA